jgi:hypothetical protein
MPWLLYLQFSLIINMILSSRLLVLRLCTVVKYAAIHNIKKFANSATRVLENNPGTG